MEVVVVDLREARRRRRLRGETWGVRFRNIVEGGKKETNKQGNKQGKEDRESYWGERVSEEKEEEEKEEGAGIDGDHLHSAR